MRRTRLETFRYSCVVVAVDVVVVVVVVVGAYSPATGNRARQLRCSAPRDHGWLLLLRIAVPLLAVGGMGSGESRSVSCDVPSPLGGDAPPDKVPSLLQAKAPLVMRLQVKVERALASLSW